MNATLTEHDVRAALAGVADPEIPTCSIVDLGLVEDIRITLGSVEVDLLPTFAGCPALDAIREDVENALRAIGAEPSVRFVLSPPWTTDRITAAGVESLKEYGIAGPSARQTTREATLQIGAKPASMPCPYCGALNTTQQSAFGPTPCRTIRYCASCRNPFEGFKTKG